MTTLLLFDLQITLPLYELHSNNWVSRIILNQELIAIFKGKLVKNDREV